VAATPYPAGTQPAPAVIRSGGMIQSNQLLQKELPMSTYSLEELLNKWERSELSIMQAIGHILQHLLRMQRQIDALKKRPAKSETD
jgi:hypothetical protein